MFTNETFAKLHEMHLACTLGNAACREFYTVRYIRLPDLLVGLSIVRSEGTFRE